MFEHLHIHGKCNHFAPWTYYVNLQNLTQGNLFGIVLIQTKFGLQLHFPIDLAPNGIPFGAESIGKV